MRKLKLQAQMTVDGYIAGPLEWQATEGWAPLCSALSVPVPDLPFPWVNRRSEWA